MNYVMLLADRSDCCQWMLPLADLPELFNEPKLHHKLTMTREFIAASMLPNELFLGVQT